MSVSIETLALAKKYTRTTVAESIGSLTKCEFSVQDELPNSGTSGIIYLIPSAAGSDAPYDSYIYESGEFVKIPAPNMDSSLEYDIVYTSN